MEGPVVNFFLEVLKVGGLPAVAVLACGAFIWRQNSAHNRTVEGYISAVKDLGEKRAGDAKEVLDRVERLTDKFNKTVAEVSTYAQTMHNTLEGRLEDIWTEIRKGKG